MLMINPNGDALFENILLSSTGELWDATPLDRISIKDCFFNYEFSIK